jgi:hypothetical protein
MNTLVLIGLALVGAGFVLLGLRFAPRMRRQFAATAAQPRTVADLVRLREQTAAGTAQPAPPAAAPRRAAAAPRRAAKAPAAAWPAARPEPPAPRVAPVPAAASVAAPTASAAPPAPAAPAPQPQAPAFVPPPPRPTPVAGRVRRDSAEAPAAALDGGNLPWQRGARMAVGLGGGQPWREPPAPPAPLRIVPTAEPPAPVEAAAPAPVRLVPEEPETRTDTPEEPVEAHPAPVAETEAAPVRLAAAPPEPAPAEDVAKPQAVWIEPGAVAAADASPSAEPDPIATDAEQAPAPVDQQASAERETGADAATAEPEPAQVEPPESAEPAARQRAVWIEPGADTTASTTRSADPGVSSVPVAQEHVPVEEPEPVEPAAQPEAVRVEPRGDAAEPAERDIPLPDAWDDVEAEDVRVGAVPDRFAEESPATAEAQTSRPRSRQSPDERAAEQAAADLALLRTFGFADPGLRPDSAPVVEMERSDEQESPAEPGDAQPVRYRVVRRDGSMVGGATVTLLDDRGGDVAAGAADAEGRGELLAPSPGGYVIVSTAAGHQPGAVAITVSGSATEIDVLIARSASVSGSVRGEDGPIAGARVTLVQDGEAVDAVDTAADGTYRIGDIGAGEYGLSVAAAGCEPVATLLDVVEEADVRHDVELKAATPVAESGGVEDDAVSELAGGSMSQGVR